MLAPRTDRWTGSATTLPAAALVLFIAAADACACARWLCRFKRLDIACAILDAWTTIVKASVAEATMGERPERTRTGRRESAAQRYCQR
jgi:hypothetical protein